MDAEIPGLFRHGTAEGMHGRGAVISGGGVYRYRLWRIWSGDRLPAAFVMLNPSTADAEADDPTIRRCTGFARSWGAGGIIVVNLFAFRATRPVGLVRAHHEGLNIRGPERDAHLSAVFSVVDTVCCAWGAHELAPQAAPEVLGLVPKGVEVTCLGLTAHGHPRHPLYLAAATPRIPFEVPRGK